MVDYLVVQRVDLTVGYSDDLLVAWWVAQLDEMMACC